jgi:hypothetical protein
VAVSPRKADAVRIDLPSFVRDALFLLLNASDESVQHVQDALAVAAPQLTARQLTEGIPFEGTAIDPGDARAIVEAIVSLYMLREQSSMSIEDILASVCESLELQHADPRTANLRRKLGGLLALGGALEVTARAVALFLEHQRVFRSARIVSDLRPVFSSRDADGPVAAMCMHTLRIDFSDREDGGAWFVALDSNDLQELKSHIERAQKKEVALKHLCAQQSLGYLSVPTRKD